MHILWDIDGTLIHNSTDGATVYLEAFTHVTGEAPRQFITNPHGQTEGQILAALLEINGHPAAMLDDVLTELDVRTAKLLETGYVRTAVPGGPAALLHAAGHGWTNALLTGNGPQHSRVKLTAAGYSEEDFDWTHSFFGDRSPDRHHLTSLVATMLGDRPSVIIGDTPNDGIAADSAQIPFIAVATGAYSVADLRDTSALVVVDDLVGGLEDVLGTIDELARRG
ncbi:MULTISPECIES: HAD family hydrolase [unclassified Salinibacterium]|uniref:HAD family hydrolase n=1 Tax=unclassified Salinibacterium TaxID=2632331 RepID=UPI001E4BD264|nr:MULTISPECIES: haloacid dehalogenase-like hydrolase [unclassified Salinibacterium]